MTSTSTEYLVEEATQALCEMLPRNPDHARAVALRVAQWAGVRPSWPYRVRLAAKIAVWPVLGVSIGVGLWMHQAKAVSDPPLKNYTIRVVDPVLAPGEPLKIAFITRRSRLCKTDVDRVILNERTETVHTIRQPGIGHAITSEPIERTIRIPLPDGLAPGRYTYRATMFSDCGAGETYVINNPDLAFEIR